MKEDYNRRKVDFNHIHATSNVHFDIFFEILNISENQRVLDIGGGYGEILLEFKKRHVHPIFYYDLLDSSTLQLITGKEKILNVLDSKQTNQYIQFLEFDLFSFIPKTTYDHVILKMVLHEFSLTDKVSVIKKAKSMLGEKGKLTIWRPYLPHYVRDFFSAIILKKDELAGYHLMLQTRYFESEEEFKEILIQADINPSEPKFIFEYLFDTSRRFESEFSGNSSLYFNWINFILEKYESESTELKKQVKLVKSSNGLYINFQRAIYQF